MSCSIKAISYYLPEKVLSNEDLKKEFPDWNIDDVSKMTGVYERHICGKNEIASDLAFKAAMQLFSEHHISPGSIDFLIYCSQSYDYLTPATACLLQERLGIPVTSGAFDLGQGCTGFIYGLCIAKGIIESGSAMNVLLLTAENLTKYIHPKDKSTRMLFGDGATATLISRNKGNNKAAIGSFILGTDGKGAGNIIMKYGGTRFPFSGKTFPDYTDEYKNIRNDGTFYMNGTSVFAFSVRTGCEVIKNILYKNNLSPSSIDMFVLHQANKLILDTIRKKMNIPPERFYIYINKCGNTVSSTIPIALYNAIKEKKVRKGGRILLASFGVGYSWGGVVIAI